VPVIGVAISIALLTQIEAATYKRAAILLAVGAALWIVNWLVVRGEPSTPREEQDERNDREGE